MDGFNDQNNTGYTDPGYAQDGYTQQYTQPQYTQPQYTQTPDMGAYNQVNTEYQSGATKCPGKEITGFILGINSIVWGGLSLLCGFIPFYGMIFAFIWGGFGIGFGIATNILHKKVHEEATEITNKIETGKKLATPGIILSIVAMVLSTIVTIVLFAIGVGAAVIGSSSQSGNFTF